MKTNIQFLTIGLLFLLALGVACGGDDDATGTTNDEPEAMSAHREPPERPDREPLIESETTADGFKAILGTGDLGVGIERIGFVLTSKTGFVTADGVQVTPRYVSGGAEEAKPTVETMFHEWPYGNRGLYAAYVDFDKAGDWVLDISLPGEGGGTSIVPLSVEVFETSHAPMQGHAAVSTKTRTIDQVESIEQLTTGSLQDPDLYQISLDHGHRKRDADRRRVREPGLLSECSVRPAGRCPTGAKERLPEGRKLRARRLLRQPAMRSRATSKRAVISPAVREWRLPSIEWTFVIDKQGIVTARFEGFATYDEVEDALRQVL